MIPTSSGSNLSKGCDPISSNCVIWQGPDLPCIDLCHGDTISDVVALLAQKLCDIIDAACTCDPDISDVVQGCLVAEGATPFATLDELLEAMIAYMCDPNNFPGGEWVDGPTGGVPLGCLDYYNDTTNSNQGSLSVTEFLAFLASKICELTGSINTINQQINLIWSEITTIQGYFPLVIPDIIISLSCDEFKGYFPFRNPTTATIQQWAVAMEQAYCILRGNVGTQQDVAEAVAAPCVLSSDPMLSVSGSYGDILSGSWFSPVTNLSQGQTNLWKVVCDLYRAVGDIQTNCCLTSCEDVIYGFLASIVPGATGDPAFINFNFTSSFIPAGFVDGPGHALIEVTDGVNTLTNFVPVVPIQNSALGFDFDISTLDPAANYTVTVNFEFVSTDGSNQTCSHSETTIVSNLLTCPSPVTLTPTTDTVAYSFDVTPNNGPNIDVGVYLTQLGVPVTSTVYTNPVTDPISGTFTGLTPGTQYGVSIVLTNSNGGSTTCADTLVTTTELACVDVQDTAAYPTTVIPQVTTLGICTQDSGVTYNNAWVVEDGAGAVSIELEVVAAPPCATDPATACIVGTFLNTASFTCGATTYNAPAGSTWYFVDSYVTAQGVTYYIYGAWEIVDPVNGTAELTDVVFCCECPTWLLDQTLNMHSLGTVVFDMVSVSFGSPVTFSVVVNPLYGNVTQTSPGVFEYEHTSAKFNQDAFQVQIDTPCGSTTAWCKILIITGKGYNAGTRTMVFIDTNTISSSDGADIVATLNSVMTQAGVSCPAFGGTPEVYYIPVADSDWLGYVRAVVDKGASATLDALPAWVALRQLPTDWTVPTPEVQMDDVQIIVFSDSYDVGYHANTLVSGFVGPPVQPSAAYQASYDDFQAALSGGVKPTVWWTGTTLTDPQFPVDFRLLVLPVVTGSVGVDSAHLLMAYAALWGGLIPEQVYVRETGDTELANYIKSPPGVINPYAGTITPAGNTIEGLMAISNTEIYLETDLTAGATPFDYAASSFVQFVYDRTIGEGVCPGTAVWELTPCPAFGGAATIYTETDLSAYEADDRAINVDGICYTVNEVAVGPVTNPVNVCADSWTGGNLCTDCSNFALTNCADATDVLVVCQNFSAYLGNAVNITGIGVDGCYTVAATPDAPGYTTPLTVATSCTGCVDCLASNLSINLPSGNWDLQDGNVWKDNGITTATDGGIVARVDSINGTCGAPTATVLGNALNLSTADEYTYETAGIVGKGPDAFTGAAVSYLTVANDAILNTGICTVYAVFAPSVGAGAQNHIWSLTANSALNTGMGLKWDGTNIVGWIFNEANPALNLTTIISPIVDEIQVIALRMDSGAGAFSMKANTAPVQSVASLWSNPTAAITLGGTPDAVGGYPAVNTAPGRLYDLIYFDQAHSDADMASMITLLKNKFNAP